ncbi:EI24 domain-containing protein [Helicobacter baculiformis]|uniref:EI24 domain-containing protein n=1 Tax=Helicobacter baculiformis TaxID=427351 RepID=A0ABV7ZEV9_9HELI|nr:EI24 domain-containing protein [Helicobacter baculiformis]
MKGPLRTIQESWKDFLSWKMLFLNLGPVLVGLLFWGILLFYFSDNMVRILEGFLPASWYHYAHSSGLVPAFFSLILKVFVYMLLGLFVLVLSLIGNILVAIFYTPIVIAYVHKKDYPNLPLEEFGDLSFCLQYFLKQLAYLCMFLLVCSPLYFIPFIGIFVSLIPHYFFFKNTLSFDIATSLFNQERYTEVLRDYKITHHKISILAYLFSLIPIFNFFATLLQTIILTRYFLEIKAQEKSSQPV